MNQKNDKIDTNEQDPEILKLFDEGEDLDQLIDKHLSEEEVDDLKEAGFRKEQIAYVAKEKKKGDRDWLIILIIADIIMWIVVIVGG